MSEQRMAEQKLPPVYEAWDRDQLMDEIFRLTAERDEWARKANEWRAKYAELRYPGMTHEVKAI